MGDTMADLFFNGGLNETDPFNISSGECIDGENFVLDSRGRSFQRRPTQDLMGTTDNGKPIRGIVQMVDRDNVETTLVKSGEVIYSWDGTTFTSERSTDVTTASRMRGSHWSLDDYMILTDLDKNDPLFKWDGTSVLRLKTNGFLGSPGSVSTLTRAGSVAMATHSTHGFSSGDLVNIAGAVETAYNGEQEITVTGADTYTYTVTGSPSFPATGTITSDFGVEVKAKYSVIKDNRLWLFNVFTSVDLPHLILVSRFEEPEDLNTTGRGVAQDPASVATGNDPFFLYTPDLHKINGVALFQKELIISTEDGHLFRLTGSDPTDYNFVDYYSGSSSFTDESMVNIGNDVMYVRLGGDIDKLTDTDRSGDVAADDASSFIPTTKQSLSDPIGVYDYTNQRALWFDQGCVLVYDKTVALLNPQVSPWSKWTTAMPSLFQTEGVAYLRRPGKTTFTVYWGDQEGKIYDLNGTGSEGDGGEYAIQAYRITRYIGDLPTKTDMLTGRAQYQRYGSCTLSLYFQWGDSQYNETRCDLPLKGPILSGDPNFWGDPDSFWGADEYWGQGTITGDSGDDLLVSTVGFSAAGRAPGFFLKTEVVSDSLFRIDKIFV
jgi:hypothetical protein